MFRDVEFILPIGFNADKTSFMSIQTLYREKKWCMRVTVAGGELRDLGVHDGKLIPPPHPEGLCETRLVLDTYYLPTAFSSSQACEFHSCHWTDVLTLEIVCCPLTVILKPFIPGKSDHHARRKVQLGLPSTVPSLNPVVDTIFSDWWELWSHQPWLWINYLQGQNLITETCKLYTIINGSMAILSTIGIR